MQAQGGAYMGGQMMNQGPGYGAPPMQGARPPQSFTGVRGPPPTFTGGYQPQASSGSGGGPVDPLDAYMASVDRELDRLAEKESKGKKKKASRNRIGDVATAREAFGPRALEMHRPFGQTGELRELDDDKLLR
mmetsp:Transcript_130035/g.236186  ORF Transcript_130035/g.236186 Transcript_130035/m.236186 type:complete len:133 (-) Transcript_130035:17-415(-)